jgi:hypothetical protein
MSGSDPRPLADQLREFLRRSPVMRGSRAALAWGGSWEQVAPPEAAGHTQVRGLRHGVLTIAVDSPPLCHELASFRRASLLAAMNARAGGRPPLKDIRFRHGPL